MTKFTRHIAVILLAICALRASAQPAIDFSPSEWDFGTIDEQAGNVAHTFVGRNTTAKPIVILEVYSSCGCTVPEFSRQPILPGGKVEIKVTYDPQNRPGSFIKELTVFDSERRKAAKLTIRGFVTPRQKTIEELYPVDAGEGLRLSESMAAFSYIYHGRPVMSSIDIANTSDRPIRLEMAPAKQSGFLMLNFPQELPAGAQGEIHIGYTIPEESGHYGVVEDVLIPVVEGREASIRILVHGLAVDNPQLSNEIYTPKAEIDKYILKFGLLKRQSGLQKLPVILTNRGDGTLIIRATEVGPGIGTTFRTGRGIEPGRSVTGYVTIDPAKQEEGPLSAHLTIVTNDPERPMRRIRVTAIVEP